MKARRTSRRCRFRLERCMQVAAGMLLAGSIALTGAQPVLAQGGDVTVTVEEVDVSSFPTVRVRIGVRDQNGVPVPELTAANLEIIEDGTASHRPSTVNAEAHPDAHVSLAIVIDLYRTMEGVPIETAQEATRDLLSDLLDQPNDEDKAAFIGVHRDLSIDPSDIDDEYEVPFTNDRNRLLNVINFLHERLEFEGPGTPLYDAVVKAIRMAAATEPIGRRALIVMTDGQDRGSVSEDSDTIQRASGAHTPVFTVGLSNDDLDEQYLRRLAENSGGSYQPAETPEDFSPLLSSVLTTLRSQYVLTYESSLPPDGQMHNVLVRVRTPTQTEGVQEYRMETPRVEDEESEEEPLPVSELPTASSTPESTQETAEEGDGDDWFTAVQDWVQDNTLMAIGVVAAVGLTFLILLVVLVIVMRRRAEVEESAPPIRPPSLPVAASPSFDVDAEGEGTWGAGEAEFAGAEIASPQETIAEGTPSLGATPSEPPQDAPSAGPFLREEFRPSGADRTRILKREPQMRVVGLLIDRDHPDQRLDVAKPVVTVGRSRENDLIISHDTVSRQHATIKMEQDRFRVYDLGSTNGTFVGDQQVRGPVPLDDGAMVRFGEKAFVFKVVSLEG